MASCPVVGCDGQLTASGVCSICTYATPEAKEAAKTAPPIQLPPPKKREPRGGAKKQKEDKKDEGKKNKK